jgi:hypothetical protein
MEPGLLDGWSRRLARRRSRRNALGIAGAGALTLLGVNAARAQNDDPGLGEDGFCRMQFEGAVRLGPSFDGDPPFTLTGLLAFKIGESGGISEGTLTTDDATYPMVGQASGKSITMRFEVGDDRTFIAVGVGAESVRACSGEYGGPASGPIRGDLGDWIATGGEASATATAGATATASGPTPTPGPCDGSTCDPRMDRSVDAQGKCVCTCPADAVECGTGCCYGGATCADPATGTCACGGMTLVLCGDTCVNPYDCPYNTQFHRDTCECTPECSYSEGISGVCCNGSCIDFNSNPEHCGGCNVACEAGVLCINGSCDCPLSCPDGCHDPATDPMNCGECGYVCGASVSTCQGGVCVCNAGLTDCNGTCVDLLSNSIACGSCSNTCRPDMYCVNGACQCFNNLTDCGSACVDLQYDKFNCGTCGTVCPDLGPNSGCIFGICV